MMAKVNKSKDVSFEKALEKLEKIVEELENGDLPLEGSLKKYEEGVNLARLCREKLDKAKKTIETLAKNSEGMFQKEPFEDEEEE